MPRYVYDAEFDAPSNPEGPDHEGKLILRPFDPPGGLLMISHMLFETIILTSLAGAMLAVLLDRRAACLIVPYAAAALSSAMAIVLSLSVLLGQGDVLLTLPTYVEHLGSFHLRVDQLSAFFLLVAAIVTMCVSVYSVGYLHEYRGRYSMGRMGFLFNIFVLSLYMVLTAGNAVLFLIMWEIMSVSSYLLVVYEWRRADSVSSGLLYLVMTHVGTAFIAAAFLLMWTLTGSFDLASFAGIKEMEGTSGTMRSAIFLFLLVGFGTKAGLVPLHVWLPRAHPAAPSNISALMSAIMVKTAAYMIIRSCFGFLGVTEVWWGLLVLLIASISALVGVISAVAETDIKRVLAYSTVENMGIIFIGIGAAMVFQASAHGDPAAPYLSNIAALALVAALFHVMSHALFKSLLFMGAGAVVSSSRTRNVEKMGGIGRRMRVTGALFFVGALSISAIPPLNGFVGEWMLFQSLFLSQTIGDPMVNILIPAAVAALALAGAIAAACFVRLYGAVFLARPRSEQAEKAEEAPRSMLAGMLVLAALCVLTGVLATLIVPVVDDVSASLLGTSIASRMVNGITLTTPDDGFSFMSPLAVVAVLLLLLPLLYLAAGRLGGPQKVVHEDTWDCGTPLGPRNQYTATGHSQPLTRLFGQFVGVRARVRETPSSSPLIPARMTFHREIEPVFERYLYDPVCRAAMVLSNRIGGIQTGSIQAYLAYIFVTLLALLVVFR